MTERQSSSVALVTRGRRRGREGLRSIATGLVLPFIVLLTWQFVVVVWKPTPSTLPPPSAVAKALFNGIGDGSLLYDLSASLWRLFLGMLAGVSLGLILGLLMGMSGVMSRALRPLVTFLNSLSGIAWIPIAIVWFGLGTGAVVFILWNSIFFLVLLNVMLGVQTVPKNLVNAGRTLGANRLRIVTNVLIPGAMANILLGVRLGHAFGWRALIAAEVIGTSSGIGFYIFNASHDQRSDRILAGIVVIGLTVLFLDRAIFVTTERLTVRKWGTVRE